jgi:hypothetical protein
MPRLRIALVAAALLLGTSWRVAPVGTAFLFGDEFHTLRDLPRGYRFLLTHFDNYGSGMALPLLQRLLVDLFDASRWTIRLPSLAAGIATLACVYPLGRRLVGAPAAAVATLLAAVSSLLIFYSHFARGYALVAWLSLLLVFLLQRIADGERAGLVRAGSCAALAALLPWVHLAALGFVLPVFAGTLVVLWRAPGRRREAAVLLGALAAGLAAALLLHVPAWTSLLTYWNRTSGSDYFGEFGVLDVAALVFGSRGSGVFVIVAVPLALAALLMRHGLRFLPLALGCAGPGLALAAVNPFGDAYAYARYAIAAVPAACLAVGWGVAYAMRWTGLGEAGRELAVLGVGALLASLLFVGGPTGTRRAPDGPYANTYMGLLPLPAFDVPWHGMPGFYRNLATEARPVRIVEVPALHLRTRHLYRNYYLQHGKVTRLACGSGDVEVPPRGSYEFLENPEWRLRCDADYLVLHLDIPDELRRYWRFVYDTHARDATAPATAAYMLRHRRYATPPGPPPRQLRAQLHRELGVPIFKDATVIVWRLREEPSPPQ